MIPRVIHYCWFGGKELPPLARKCIESWQIHCPDYEIVQWNESNYDIAKNTYMHQAYQVKKWGFVPDYARLDIMDLHRKRPVIRYSMHSFRHTFCTLSINRGISLSVIQSIVGHSTALMTSHYSHISIESKRNAIQAISLLEPSINS